MFYRFFFGDDIFISYSRADAAIYAAGLANELTKLKFSCKFDQWGTPPGRELPKSLKRAIRSSAAFVLVATPAAINSDPVEQEITEFKKTRRMIVPLDVGGVLKSSTWWPQIEGLYLSPENAEALTTGNPSPAVVNRIEKTFKFTRRDVRLRRTALAVAALLMTLLLGTLMATAQAQREKAAAYSAKREAADQQRIAREKTDQAALSDANAKKQQAIAELRTNEAQVQQSAAAVATQNAVRQQQIAHERLTDVYQEQGRLELLRGKREQALVYLTDAYLRRPGDEVLQFLVALGAKSLVTPLKVNGYEIAVNSAEFNPDGSRIVTAGDDNTVKVSDAGTGEVLMTLPRPIEGVQNVTFSPDGKYLLTSGYDKVAELWDASTGKLVRLLRGHQSSIHSAKFSAEGDRIVTASSDGTAKIWRTSSGEMLSTLGEHNEARDRSGTGVASAEFSSDGNRIATADSDGAARTWDAATGRMIHILRATPPQEARIVSAAFSPDGKRIVTAAGKVAMIWDADSGELIRATAEHEDDVNVAWFSPDGELIVTGSEDNMARIWSARSGELLHTLKGHEGGVTSIAFSPNGHRVVTACEYYDSTAKIWDLESGDLIDTITINKDDTVKSAKFSPDGRYIVTASGFGRSPVGVWDATKDLFHAALTPRSSDGADGDRDTEVQSARFDETGSHVLLAHGTAAEIWNVSKGTLEHTIPVGEFVQSAEFSVDGQYVLTTADVKGSSPGGWIGTATIWDLRTATAVHSLRLRENDSISSALFSHNGMYVVASGTNAGSASTITRVWDAKSSRILYTFERDGFDSLLATRFSPDSRYLSTSGEAGVMVYDLQAGKLLYHLKDQDYASFSPDGGRMVTASSGAGDFREGNFDARIWRTHDGRRLGVLKRHEAWIDIVEFSPDGRYLLTASEDATTRIWNAQTYSLLVTLGEHQELISQASFSRSGRRVITSSWDGLAKIWDAQRGSLLFTIAGQGGKIDYSAFSPDGHYVLTHTLSEASGGSGIVKLWDVQPELRKPKLIENLAKRLLPEVTFETAGRRITRDSSSRARSGERARRSGH